MAEAYTTERIVQEFMDVTVKELRYRELTDKECLRYISFITDDIILGEHLSAEKIQDMTYIELICLIDRVGGNPRYDRRDHDSVSRQLFYYLTLARALTEASVFYNDWVSEPVERFSKLSLKEFYAYMDSVSDHEKLQTEFAYIKNCCEYRDYYTIGDFISEKSWISRRAWYTTEPLEEYGKKIRDAQKDIGRLLIDSFHLAFPDRFRTMDICNKYHAAIEDGGEDDPFEENGLGKEPAEPFHQAFSHSSNIMADCNDFHHFADKYIDDENSPYNRLEDEKLHEEADDKDKDTAPDYMYPLKMLENNDDNIEKLLIDLGEEQHSPTLYREDIISQLMSVLISESKPNALLVGPSGAGKTKIVEELAYRITVKDKSVPSQLYGYKVYSLRISDIAAGSGLVGDLEKKVDKLLRYLSAEDRKAILFMDEVHMLFSGETYKKIAQMFKPALSRGQIKTIAATTTQEVKSIDADPAFNRRFTRIQIFELSKEQTRTILLTYREKLSKHYGVMLDMGENMADLIINIADESRSVGVHRPDNALTLLDRAVALAVVNGQKEAVRLDSEHIERTALRMTSGNSEVGKFDERVFRSGLARIKGQDNITNNLARVIKLHDMHIRPRKKPLTFLFAGASGVGKTEVARIIADTYIRENPIILNMAEFHSSASINRIIGAPAGYVGFSQNSELPFDALDTNPYQVILLDEFEKCDRAVQRLFMSAFDEGIMQTNFGKGIDFSKAIIIATTNAGCTEKKSLGFGSAGEKRNLSISDLSDYFDVELLNRFEHIYTFRDISKEIYREIVRETYEREIVNLRLEGTDINVEDVFDKQLSENDLCMLVSRSYDPRLGARPALTAVTEFIDNRLLAYMDGKFRSKADIKREFFRLVEAENKVS